MAKEKRKQYKLLFKMVWLFDDSLFDDSLFI